MNTKDTSKSGQTDAMLEGYTKMLNRAQEGLNNSANTPSNLRSYLDSAKEQAVTLNELSREQAEKISDYLWRDLHDAAHFLTETQQELVSWLRFDLELIEERLFDVFSVMVDHTQLELHNLAERARCATEWNSGEIIGIGTLVCDQCQYSLTFHQPAYIPVCPNCGGTAFKRTFEEDDENSDAELS